MTKIQLVGGPLDGERHEVHGLAIPDVIEKPWPHSTCRHIYELAKVTVGGYRLYRYLHVKSYRPATQECEGR